MSHRGLHVFQIICRFRRRMRQNWERSVQASRSPTTIMLEITADDIAKLDDEQLRAVVARLCESELRQRGYSPVHVTWGGHQKASDGGIDVNVALPSNLLIKGF